MSDPKQWQESNARQLVAALAKLRDLLERFSQRPVPPAKASGPPGAPPEPVPASKQAPPPPPPAPAHPKSITRSSILLLLSHPAEPAKTDAQPSTSPPPSAEVPPAPVTVESDAVSELPSALDQLGERLNLSSFEKNILLLCAAMELDTRIAGLCARAHDDPQKPYPTFALALALFADASWDALSPEASLRYWRLIEINPLNAQPLTASALRADERIVNYLKGLNYVDDRLRSYLLPLDLEAGPAAMAPSQGEVVEIILRRWQQAAETGPLPVVQLVGSDTVSKQLIACHAASQLNRGLYRLPVDLLPSSPVEAEILARLWQREGRLSPLALYLDAEEMDDRAPESTRALSRFLSRGDGVFFLGVREVLPRPGRGYVALDVSKPTTAEQQAAWASALGEDAPGAPSDLAAQFDLNLSSIKKLARMAQIESQAAPASLNAKAWEVCCAAERPRLDSLAQRLEPKMTWDDLVLPAAEMLLLRQMASQVGQRNKVYQDWGFAGKLTRGLGISALFAGESGTGKTMAAEVIANGLRLNLYRIDLSAVVNKYIGETEKNLRRLFDAAENGGAILFFDEADALFGKRSEVKDSHDRYANIEINYLLQRLESYRGLAILATNLKSALDPAFLRRLRFVIDFPCPSLADRRRLWQRVFRQREAANDLPAPPLDSLDYDRLARLNMPGGDIQNTALNSTFMAAQAGTKVTMTLILKAARAEFLKRNRHITEAEFSWTASAPANARPAAKDKEPALV
jgi:hypothetical protein